MKKTIKFAALVMAAGSTCFAEAADLAVGFRTAAFSNTVEQTGYWLLAPESEFSILSGNGLTLDPSKVYGAETSALRVGAGEVSVSSSGSSAAFPVPTDVLNRAALWMDASTNVVMKSDGTSIDYWLDVRETPGTAPANCVYYRAKNEKDVRSEATAYPVKQTVDGKDSIYFNGKKGGASFRITRTADNEVVMVDKIKHVFIIHGVYNSYGYLLGGTLNNAGSKQKQGFWNLYSASRSAVQPVFGYNATDFTHVFHSRFYVDGELVDPQHTQVPTNRLSSCEIECLSDVNFCAFYNERYLSERTGGDNLCEVVVFTNSLSDVERLSVGTYLQNKWLGRKSQRPLNLSENASASFAVAGEVPVVVTGEGVLKLTASGTVSLTNSVALANDRSCLVQPSSATTVVAGPAVTYDLTQSGQTLAVNDHLLTVSAGTAGTVAKTGTGTAAVRGVPSGTTELRVEAGSLTLAAPGVTTATALPAEVLEPILTDGSFENLTTQENGKRVDNPNKTFDNGVRLYDMGKYDANLTSLAYVYSSKSDALGMITPPDGKYAMFLGTGASVSLPLSVRTPGVYEISYVARGRSGTRQGQQHRIAIAQSGVTQTVGIVTHWANEGAFRPFKFLTPPLVADASSELIVEGIVEAVNAGTFYDDFKIKYHGASSESGVVAVPNGDFECQVNWPINTAEKSNNQTREGRGVFSADNTIDGWTFVQGSNCGTTNSYLGCPQIGLVAAAFVNGTSYSKFFDLGENRYGAHQLALFGNGGYAERQPFPVAAGTYRVRAELGWFTVTQPNGNAQTSYIDVQTNTVSVKVGDGAWQEVAVWIVSSKLFTKMYSSPFVVPDGGAAVSIRFSTGDDERACALMDNVALVPGDEVPRVAGFELLANPYPRFWTSESHTDEGGGKSGIQIYQYTNDQTSDYWQFGGEELCPSRPLGEYYVMIAQRALKKTSVEFPSAGRYRLTFWAAQRHDMTGQLNRGNCPLEAWLVDSAEHTNLIARTVVDHNHWLQYAFDFELSAGGTYTLGLQGGSWYSPTDPSNNHSVRLDDVSVRQLGTEGDGLPTLPQDMKIIVASGTTLNLEYFGTNRVRSVRFGGRSAGVRVISAATNPDYITGPGALEVMPTGTVILFN